MGYGTFHCTFAEIEQRLLARGTIAKHEIIHVVMVSEPHIIIGESLAKNLKNGSTEQTYYRYETWRGKRSVARHYSKEHPCAYRNNCNSHTRQQRHKAMTQRQTRLHDNGCCGKHDSNDGEQDVCHNVVPQKEEIKNCSYDSKLGHHHGTCRKSAP